MTGTSRLLALLLVLLPSLAVAELSEVQGRLEAVWVDRFEEPEARAELRVFIKEPGRPAQRIGVSPDLLSRLGPYSEWVGARASVFLAGASNQDDAIPGAVQIKLERYPPDTHRLQRTAPGQAKQESTESLTLGEHLWLTVMCKFADFDDEVRPPEYFQDMYGDDAEGLTHYWSELSYGKLRLTGEAASEWVTLPKTWAEYDDGGSMDIHELFDDCTAAAAGIVDYSRGYSGIVLMFNSDIGAGGYGGGRYSDIDGASRYWPTAWLSYGGLQRESVVAHEIGHALGLPHSDNGDGDNDPYDSPWDVMSSTRRYSEVDPVRGNLGKHTVAHHKERLGWLRDGELLLIDEPGSYTVEVGAMAQPGFGGYRAIRVPEYDSSDSYTLEARKRVGRYDAHLPGDAVILSKQQQHRYILGSNTPSWVMDSDTPPADYGDNEGSMMKVGEVFADEDRMIRVSVDAETEDGFVVTVDSRWIPNTVSCTERHILIDSQQAVDEFKDRHGDCDTVLGDLTIGSELGLESPHLANLWGLDNIRFVHGTLAIQHTSQLRNLAGLDKLERAGRVVIRSNRDLLSLDGLGSLRETRELHIAKHAELGTLSGLQELAGSLDYLHLFNNWKLTGLDGLQRIESVTYDFSLFNNELLADCSALQTLLDNVDDYQQGPGASNMPNVPDIGGSVDIRGNAEGCNARNEIAPIATPARLITGSWYEPELSGAGFMVHAIDENRAVAYYYGYDINGERYWMIGVHDGPIEWTNTADFVAMQVSGGQFGEFDPDDIVRQDWGHMRLYLYNCNEALMSLEGTFAGSDEFIGYLMPLERLAATAGTNCDQTETPKPIDGVTGSWYDPDTSGQGFAVHKIDDDRGIVYFYGFDKAGGPLWLIGVWEGGIEFGQLKSITMQQARGGHFYAGFDPDDIIREDWGTLNLRFTDCGNAWAHMTGRDGSHTLNLKLLAGSAGSVCQDP